MAQPKALYLADILEDAGKPADIAEACAAELRRLSAVEAQRDALLEALKEILAWGTGTWDYQRAKASCDKARAAIAAVEGEPK